MYSLEIQGRSFGPYEALIYPDGSTKGDMRPILYDAAMISLVGTGRSFALGHKISKNLFGKDLHYADVIDMQSGESFSLQVSNIFLLKVVSEDVKILAKVGDTLRWYQNFGKTEFLIEPDGDKKELTPLGYFDMYIRYDDDFYYPIILDENIRKSATVERFFDYYGFKTYTDTSGANHFILLIESEESTEAEPVWYWTDNFRKSSDILEFDDETESVENWEINDRGQISMVLTSGTHWYVDNGGKLVKWDLPKVSNEFAYTRYFEDTDSSVIVGKNLKGLFLVDRNAKSVTEDEQKHIAYFEAFLACDKWESPLFLMKKHDGDVVMLDKDSQEILTTDLYGSEVIVAFFHDAETKSYVVQVKDEGERRYVMP